jgi:cation transporter-like permease
MCRRTVQTGHVRRLLPAAHLIVPDGSGRVCRKVAKRHRVCDAAPAILFSVPTLLRLAGACASRAAARVAAATEYPHPLSLQFGHP